MVLESLDRPCGPCRNRCQPRTSPTSADYEPHRGCGDEKSDPAVSAQDSNVRVRRSLNSHVGCVLARLDPTGFPRCPSTRRSTNWLTSRTCAGASSAPTKKHYEGRSWRGFHHHATLSIAAYGFLVAEQLTSRSPTGREKNFIQRQVPSLPADYVPRGSPACATTRARLDHNAALSDQPSPGRKRPALPVLRSSKRNTSLVTQ